MISSTKSKREHCNCLTFALHQIIYPAIFKPEKDLLPFGNQQNKNPKLITE